MLTDRKDLYRTLIVSNNKELDLLDTQLPYLEIDNYTTFTVPQFAVGRIDIISFIHYETVDLWWIIAHANDIIDVTSELYMGRVLRIPSVTSYYGFYNANSLIDEIDEVFDTRPIT